MPAINPNTEMGSFRFNNDVGNPVAAQLTAGEAYIGDIGRSISNVSVSQTTSGSGLYATGQYIGVSGVATEIAGVGRVAGGCVTLMSSLLTNYGATNGSLEAWIFDSAVVPPANKAAFGVSDADMAHLQAVVPFTTYYTSGSASSAWGDKTTLGMKCAAGSTSLYQCLVSRASASYETTDLSVKWSFIQD
jgi:hypothetical protein